MSLGDLYARYHEQVRFLMIYIREAHPVDGWWLGKGWLGKLVQRYAPSVALQIYDPQTIDERRKVAGECEQALDYGVHTYVDDMDDAVNQAYAASPARLYLIGMDGKVVYAGGLGPLGFKPGELGDAIQSYLAGVVNHQG